MASFRSRKSQNTLSWPILLKNKTGQNIKFFTKNHGLTPLEKYQIFVFFKWMFFEFKMAKLLSRSSQNTLYGLFLLKNKQGQNF